MRQVFIPRIGDPGVLEVREASDPEVKAGEVRIRVEASGVNFADIMARMGLYPDAPPVPCVVGYEVAGKVDQVGADTNGFAEGDRVLAFVRFGGYSDVLTAPAAHVSKIDDAVTFEQAAAIPVNYATAWLMLVYLGNVKKGDRVLIHGAGGGVGQAAVQICNYKGAEIFGTASAGKHARLKELGVSHCIDYRSQDFEAEVKRITGDGVDIVIDPLGGDSFQKSYRSLRPLGRLYLFGVSKMAPGKRRSVLSALGTVLAMPKFKPIHMMNSNRGVHGVNLGHLWNRIDDLSSILDEIGALTASGTFAPVVDRTFKFEDAGDAHAYIQDRKNFGKVLLVP